MRDDHSMSNMAQRLIDEFESVPADAEDALDDLTDEQREVIDRRLAEHARDPDSAIPWDEGRTRLYRRFA